MIDDSQRPISTPPSQRAEDFRQRRLPLIVWGTAASLCVLLLVVRGTRFEYIGLAQALSYEISATTTGKLESVFVDVYDEVEAGDVVARLDDKEVEARLERSQATLGQLAAELEATRTQLASTGAQDRASWSNNLRRFQTDEEQRRLESLELRVAVESGEIERERLALDVDRSGPLLEAGLIGRGEFDSLRLLHDEVTRRNEETRRLLAQTEQEYLAAQARRREFERGLPSIPAQEPLLRPLREAISVESQRLEEIRARRETLVLRSPVAGQVSQVLCRAGQTVVPGEPILTIAEHGVKEIVAYVAEADRRVVRRQSPVVVSSLARPGRVADSYVVRVGPGLELLPARLWPNTVTPAYGRAVVVATSPALELTPGELIQIKFVD